MSKRFGARLVLFFLLASALLAAAPGTTVAADLTGKGSIGGSLGLMKFLSGDDFGEGNLRFIGQAMFKYHFSRSLAGVLESGWGWNAYPVDQEGVDDTLATVIPTTIGLEWRKPYGESKLWPHAGAGVGLYWLGVKDSYRTWARDAQTNNRLTWASPGLYGKLGAELYFDAPASINWDLVYHMIFSKDEDQFPAGWGNQSTSFAEFRMGASYYFTVKGNPPRTVPGEEPAAEKPKTE